jgi:hypothetical protein
MVRGSRERQSPNADKGEFSAFDRSPHLSLAHQPRSGYPPRHIDDPQSAERCRSGRSGRSRKPLWVCAHRGFESHPLRHPPLKLPRSRRYGTSAALGRWNGHHTWTVWIVSTRCLRVQSFSASLNLVPFRGKWCVYGATRPRLQSAFKDQIRLRRSAGSGSFIGQGCRCWPPRRLSLSLQERQRYVAIGFAASSAQRSPGR